MTVAELELGLLACGWDAVEVWTWRERWRDDPEMLGLAPLGDPDGTLEVTVMKGHAYARLALTAAMLADVADGVLLPHLHRRLLQVWHRVIQDDRAAEGEGRR